MEYTVQIIRDGDRNTKQTFRGIGIHSDDSISVIKQKIIHAGVAATVGEIYMFVEIVKTLDINTLWEEDEERPAVIFQNIPTAAAVASAADTHHIYIPLGFHYENDTWSPLIQTNPFLPRGGGGGTLAAYENDLLLNYFGEDGAIVGNTIYVCLAEDVAAARDGDGDEWLLYFPILKQKGITTTEEFVAARNTLKKEATAAKKHAILDTIQPYYDLAAASGAPAYTRRGIRAFRCKIRPKYKINIPLDGVFKILQTSAVVPFIKYNPASRQENLYRLYTERIAKNGKKIPFLAKSHINSLSRKIGKSKQVAVYITVPDMRELDIHTAVELYVVFEPNGEITIFNEEFAAISAVSIETLEKVLKQLVQPVIKQFVNVLGLEDHIPTELRFGGGGGAIEIIQMKYMWLLPFSGDIKRTHVQSLGGCFLSLFEKMVDFDNLKRGHILKYRRVQNYQEMDGERELITSLFQKYERTEDVLTELIQVYKKDPTEARQMVGKYIDTIHLYTDKQGNIKVVENAGFVGFIQSVEIQQKYYIMLEFDNITSLFYLPPMQTYMDGFFQLFLFPKSVPAAVMKQMKDVCKIRAAAAAVATAAPAPAPEPELKKKILQHIVVDSESSSSEESAAAAAAAAAEAAATLDEPIEIETASEVSDDASEEFDMDLMGDDASVAGSMDMDLMGDETRGGAGGGAEEDEDAAAAAAAELEHMKQMKKGESLFDNPIGKRLFQYDPVLFAIPTNKKEFTNFSRACPVVRQPVVLNDEEKEYIDKNHRGAYTTAIRYGSDTQKQYWYICPRYWCVLNNTAMTEEDVRAGKCGNSAKIIPRDAKKIPEDAFVYEFNDYGTEHLDPKTKQYRPHYPGLMKHTKHRISHLKFPCCFKKEQKELLEHLHNSAAAAGLTDGAPAPEIDANAISYIYDGAKTPVPEGRLAFLPVPIQQYLQTNNGRCVEKNKPFEIKRDTTCIVKAGVEKNSFLGCILKIIHYKHGASARARTIPELQQFLSDLVGVDDFMAYQNGALVKAFYRAGGAVPKAPTDISPETAKLFEKYPRMRDRVLAAHAHFLEFLRDKENAAVVDYTYLWDMITQPNIKLFPDGMNLVILKLPENDPTMNVEVICPTSVYSNTKLFDAAKETIIMIKTEAADNRDYYDLVSLYHHSSADNVIKIASVFHPQKTPENIKRVMTYIEYTIGLYCAPRAAPAIEPAPDRIDFVRAPPLSRVLSQLAAVGGEITRKIINSQGNVVGMFVRRGAREGFVPCAPMTHYSKILPDIRTDFIDDEDLPWLPYRETVDFLKSMSAATGLPCAPVVKVVDGGFIVGVITQTNQFVAIDTPVEDLRGAEDGLRAFHNNNTILTEKELYGDAATEMEDPERVKITKYIRLESQFFQAFRRLVRAEIIRGGAAAEIARTLDEPQISYKTKLREIDSQLRELMRERVEFVDYKEDVLMKLDIITVSCGDGGAHCSPAGRLLIPRKHLIHREVDNRAVYFGRVADELIRYKQLRAFMFQPKTYMNTSRVKYNLTNNEIILLQSTIDAKVGNYFDNLIHDKFIISFTRAVPSVAVARDDNYMTVEQQRPTTTAAAAAAAAPPQPARAPPAAAQQEDINANLKHTIDAFDKIIGNNRSEWVKRFPKTCKEIIFKNTAEASFSVVLYILQSIHKKEYMVAEIKQWLVEIYTKKISARDLPVVLYILKTEGKGDIIQKVNSSVITLETAIMSYEYYMTNLDLYALIHYYGGEFSTNIILMTALYLKDIFAITKEKINWMLLRRAAGATYFIRSPTDFKTGVVPTYSLVVPSVEIPEMSLDFQEEYTRATAPHIYSFEDYLRGRRELIRGAAGKAARAAAEE